MAQEIKRITDNDAMKDTNDQESKWVYDSSVDYKGNTPAKASTGAWRAAIFVIAMKLSERVTYYTIAVNLISYLTKVLNQDIKTAAKNVNCWSGVSAILPLFGAFLADAYLGRFFTIFLSSIIYLVGLSLLTMSEFIPILKPCNNVDNHCSHDPKVHGIVFFIGLYLLSIGAGGNAPSLESFGADQFDENHSKERMQRMSFFNWWNFVVCFAILLSGTLFVYVEDNLGWGVASSVLTSMMGVSLLIFYFGKPYYRYKDPRGSPLILIYKVLVAALSKRNLPHPSNPDMMLYEIHDPQNIQGRLLCHTNNLRFLDKAAIVETDDIPHLGNKGISRKRLATVTMIEETKLIINTIPMWLTSVIFGVCPAQASTFFIKQSSMMNRRIGNRFEIPPASIGIVGPIAMLFMVSFYEKILIPALRRARGDERGLKILQRIGIGMVFPVLMMAIAALVEKKRLTIAEKEAQTGQSLTMSVFWIVPQYMMMGIGDAFAIVGLQEFFYEQVPESMRSLGIAFLYSALGVGSFANSAVITITAYISGKLGISWFGKDLNSSRLDKFYWLMTVISIFNLCVYVFFARRHSYKSTVKKKVVVVDDLEEVDRTHAMT